MMGKALRFQDAGFLANYAAMQHRPDPSESLFLLNNKKTAPEVSESSKEKGSQRPVPAMEIGGREGPEPTRYGDWEKAGRCIDF